MYTLEGVSSVANFITAYEECLNLSKCTFGQVRPAETHTRLRMPGNESESFPTL